MRSLRSAARGVSLIECLVALTILSVGLMGMASLMIGGLRAGRAALFRTHAVNLVSDMVERIRANPSAGGAYECARYIGGPSEHDCAVTDSTAGASCTPAELAEDDLARWHSAARALLPLASDAACVANVTYSASPAPDEPARYRVSVAWSEPGEAALLSYQSDLLLVPLQ